MTTITACRCGTDRVPAGPALICPHCDRPHALATDPPKPCGPCNRYQRHCFMCGVLHESSTAARNCEGRHKA